VRKIIATVLLIGFVAFVVYGVTAYQFDETFVNGAMICLSCIGVG